MDTRILRYFIEFIQQQYSKSAQTQKPITAETLEQEAYDKLRKTQQQNPPPNPVPEEPDKDSDDEETFLISGSKNVQKGLSYDNILPQSMTTLIDEKNF